jgi:ribosomal protein S4
VEKISDVLALNKEDWLKRRLQTVLFSKGIALTPNQARQLIVHKHVSISGQVINVPSYMVKFKEESEIFLNLVLKTNKLKSKEEIIKEEILERVNSGENISTNTL